MIDLHAISLYTIGRSQAWLTAFSRLSLEAQHALATAEADIIAMEKDAMEKDVREDHEGAFR